MASPTGSWMSERHTCNIMHLHYLHHLILIIIIWKHAQNLATYIINKKTLKINLETSSAPLLHPEEVS